MFTVNRFQSDDPEDRNSYERMWRAYEGHRARAEVKGVMVESNWNAFIAADGRLYAYALRADGVAGAVGFAQYIYHFCTKSVRPECYLSDLYVSEEHRGRGGGGRLVDAVIAECREKNMFRLTWITEQDNRPAQKLYSRYVEGHEWIRYKLILADSG